MARIQVAGSLALLTLNLPTQIGLRLFNTGNWQKPLFNLDTALAPATMDPAGKFVFSASTAGLPDKYAIGGAQKADPLGSAKDAHTGRITAMAITHDGNRVITGGTDGMIRLWNSDGKQVARPREAQRTPVALAVSPKGMVAVATRGAGVFYFRLDWLSERAAMDGAPANCSDVAVTADDSVLAATCGQRLLLWATTPPSSHNAPNPPKADIGLPDAPKGLAFSPDGKLIAVAAGSAVHIWAASAPGSTELKEISFQGETPSAVAFLAAPPVSDKADPEIAVGFSSGMLRVCQVGSSGQSSKEGKC